MRLDLVQQTSQVENTKLAHCLNVKNIVFFEGLVQ